jgi:predicted DNA-binding transcriptional regulator AlpA
MPEVEATTGLSRSTIYRRVKAGAFPGPVPLGSPHVAEMAIDAMRRLLLALQVATS